MKYVFLTVFAAFLLWSCDDTSKLEKEIANIPIDIEIERFDQLFVKSNPENLQKLKNAYPFMFSARYSDSIWLKRMTDTLQQQMALEIDKTFQSMDNTEDEIIQLYQHLNYYFPELKAPRIITVNSDVEYRTKVIVTDTIALVSLDTYLGEDHEYYGSIQKYIRQNLNKNQIVPDLSNEYAKRYTYQSKRKTLLDEMVYYGKLLYFKDMVIPFKSDSEKIGYTDEQLQWAILNESEIWRYFVDRELLFSTDSKLPARFINPAPFSKFQLELDAESPGRLGQYIGWQIVRAYMNKNDASFKEMLSTDAETIFNQSKFKPRK